MDCFVFQKIPFWELLFVSCPHFLLAFMVNHIMIIKFMTTVCYRKIVPRMITATKPNNLVASLRTAVNLLVLSLLMN